MLKFFKNCWEKTCAFVEEKKTQLAQFVGGVTVVSGATLSQPAHAVIDVTTATNGITDVGVALAAIIGGLLGLAMTIYGINAVYKFMSKKSGTN